MSTAVRPGTFLSHEGTRTSAGAAPLPQTQFRATARPDGSLTLSPILLPGMALAVRHDGSLAIGAATDPGAAFQRIGRADGGVTLASVAHPGKAIGLAGTRLILVPTGEAGTAWKIC
jgi:hypothetical protein